MENSLILIDNNFDNKFKIIDKFINNEFIYFIDSKNNININFNIEILNDTTSSFNFIILNNNDLVNLKVNCIINGSNINSKINVLIYGLNESKSNIDITYKDIIDCKNSYVEQNIFGILLSDYAKIIGFPKLAINSLDINANHSLKIGTLDEEEIFYLLTKGFDLESAKKILLKTHLYNLINSLKDNDKKICIDAIQDKIF